jgi:hypothetical protein
MMQIQSAMLISTPPTSTQEQSTSSDTDFASILSTHTEQFVAPCVTETSARDVDYSAPSEDLASDSSKSASETELANAAAGSVAPQVAPVVEAHPDAELTASVLEAIEAPSATAAPTAALSLDTAANATSAEPAAVELLATLAGEHLTETSEGLTQTSTAQPAPALAPVVENDVAGTGEVDLSVLEGASITVTPGVPAVAAADPEAPLDEITVTVAPALAAVTPTDDSVTDELSKVLNGTTPPSVSAPSATPSSSTSSENADPDTQTPAAPAPVSVDQVDGVTPAKHSEAFSLAASSDVRPTSQTRAAVTENIRSEVWAIAQRAQNLARVEAVVHTALGDLSVVARHTANGVQVTLAGDAAANLDLASLQGQLPGLDVSVDLSQQSRALEWEPDTVVPRALSSAPQIVSSPSLRSSKSQLDVLA